jgi:GNAT superfamily N-acetyltransferase
MSDVVLRPWSPGADLPGILRLLQASLGWGDGPAFRRFFEWKHREGAFGPSPAWVAVDGETIVGLRILMRWEFESRDGGARAVRAVDTATHPDHQGRGIFSRLTRLALEDLERDGVDFVFNTPNDKSRPGYLKMGWQEVGRLPVHVRPLSLGGIVRIARARTSADRWSASSTAGEPAATVLSDRDALAQLLAARRPPVGTRTRVTPEYLAWRYGGDLLPYRAVVAGAGLAHGVAFFRVRERGAAREAALCEVLTAGDDDGVGRELVRRAARAADADYLLALRGSVPGRGLFPLPGQGPVLTWRKVATPRSDPPAGWQLGLGDIELF